jgi:hypothetical protein
MIELTLFEMHKKKNVLHAWLYSPNFHCVGNVEFVFILLNMGLWWKWCKTEGSSRVIPNGIVLKVKVCVLEKALLWDEVNTQAWAFWVWGQ